MILDGAGGPKSGPRSPAGGIALSHLSGLPAVAGAAMGTAAMCAVLVRFPLTPFY